MTEVFVGADMVVATVFLEVQLEVYLEALEQIRLVWKLLLLDLAGPVARTPLCYRCYSTMLGEGTQNADLGIERPFDKGFA